MKRHGMDTKSGGRAKKLLSPEPDRFVPGFLWGSIHRVDWGIHGIAGGSPGKKTYRDYQGLLW